ncbi:glutathione S-transferase family protein [Jiella sp. MQZ9-1]|uniref:Glutathione S-transferase family protein n=1 Tax=Jiella flava TaxID=2816857 RepID=A0A939JSX4_9HYPH|nr:glutathione S-transferase family protein [Jiella flava]MBO0663408.1 glutathione S-transferase family protein [Jiella flava]MCD2471984.1 glutathione S-transferase family protein [Jiella flava]
MITIYGMPDSGNCYKPRLLCALTGQTFQHVTVSMIDGGTRRPAYLAKNANGKVPLLELGDGRLLPESNAILWFLGEATAFVPADAFARAEMLSWMFFEQYSHEPAIAVRRSLMIHPHRAEAATPERLAETLVGGEAALRVMEARLAAQDWLAGSGPSLADIALYAYTHVAEEGGFELTTFPAVSAWLARVAALPGYQPMTWLPET